MRPRWVLAAVATACYLVGVPIDLVAEHASGWYAGSATEALIFQPAILATFVVGWLLVLRRAGGVIGWLLLANWAVLVTAALASTYAGYAYGTGRDLPGARAGGDLGHPRLAAALRRVPGHRVRGAGRSPPLAAVAARGLDGAGLLRHDPGGRAALGPHPRQPVGRRPAVGTAAGRP